MDELRVLSPTAILGYGFPEESFKEGMKRKPDVIAVDAGSTDPGPYYLGSGLSFTDRNAVKRDLALMIPAAIEHNIPVIVGTAGGCGADSHLEWTVDIVKEIAKEQGLTFKLATMSAQIPHETVKENLAKGHIKPLHPAPQITAEDVDKTTRIVAQMGPEPYIQALNQGAQVIIAGRTYDPAVFASLAIKEGFDPGLATHMGKILECAAIAATPGSGSDCMFGTLRKDHFELQPLSSARKCTTLSVAAHTLYEKSNPLSLPGPGGLLDLTQTKFEQATENSVIVRGSRFIPTPAGEKYTVKLEGAKKVGYRTVSFAATADPIMISQIDNIVESVKERVKSNFAHLDVKEFFLDFKIYGQNGVMGIFKDVPTTQTPPNELAIIIEAVAPTQELASTICSFARSTMLHFGYEGRKSTAGNLAFPFSPSDFKVGEVYEFSLYHLMDVDDPCQHFPVVIQTCHKGELQ
ncbi:acyclic terpene utilization AtuA family protein [Neisseria sp. Ec49-e6-T10]|uniref:acyclic terpene utilization AtuA family protein n=1 Tax=Neisseria sp. Ec49-e6-T10 TaxID=3140744 RepID=UPI003EB95598